MIVTVPCDMRKELTKDTFFWTSKFPEKEPIDFCKSCDNDVTFLVVLQSNHFINPNVWFLVFDLHFMTSVLVKITDHKGM